MRPPASPSHIASTGLPSIERTPLPDSRPLRVLLVKPDCADTSVGLSHVARVPPLDLMTVAGAISEHDTRIVDTRLEGEAAFASALRDFRPDIVGMTAYSAEAVQAKALCRMAKTIDPSVTVVQGGFHATMAPDDAFDEPAVDFLVLGEAEETLPELIVALRAGQGFERVHGIAFRADRTIHRTPARPPLDDLDGAPYPAWEKVARYQGAYYLNVLGTVVGVESTRGCPYDCAFCSVWTFHQRLYRKKSIDRVLEEVGRLPEAHVTAFFDDEFWVDSDRSLQLADRITSLRTASGSRARNFWAQVRTGDIARTPELVRRWAHAGLKVLLLGIESHKEPELHDLHHKRSSMANTEVALDVMRDAGVEAWGCFIVNPEWDKQDFLDLESFVRRHRIAFPQFSVLTPLPGTVLTNRLVQAGALRLDKLNTQLLDFLHAATPTKLPLRQFYESLARLYERTSIDTNVGMFRRALRNRVISSEWLRSEMGARVRASFGHLADPDAYLQAHRLIGEDV